MIMVGCGTQTTFEDLGCVWTRDIYGHEKDTPGTLAQIAAHDTERSKHCPKSDQFQQLPLSQTTALLKR